MEDKLNPTIVGAFVLVLGAALIAAVLWLAAGVNSGKKLEPYRSIVAESVAGLNIDAPVKYLGVDVGKVRTITIDPQNSRQVLLGFSIEQGTPVKEDSEAVLKTQGLTGIVYVELSGGSPGSVPLVPTQQDPAPLIRSKPSLSTRLENVLGSVLSGLDRMSGNLNSVFDADNRAALKATLADAATLMHTLAAQRETISATLTDAAQTARQTALASAQLESMLARISGAATAVDQMAQNVTLTSTHAGVGIDSAASGVQQLRNETLPELERMIAEVNQLATSLRHLSEQTERNPSSLLVGGPTRPAGPGEGTIP